MMKACTPEVCLLGLMLLSSSLHAAEDPAGHWKGAISAPGRQFRFEADFYRDPTGKLLGVVSLPEEKLSGIPLRVESRGRSLKFNAREDQPFDGELSPDGRQVFGEYTIEGNVLPFVMRRDGDAVPPPVVEGGSVPAEVEGEWAGQLDGRDGLTKVRLLVQRTPAGRTRAVITNLSEGGLQLPVILTNTDTAILMELPTGGRWRGTMSGAEQLQGVYEESGSERRMVFWRPAR